MTSLGIGKFLEFNFITFILPILEEYYAQNIDDLNYIKKNIKFLKRDDKKSIYKI